MSLTLEDKKAIVAEVSGVAKTAYSAIAAEYSGLTVEQMTQLRVQARKSGVYLRVVKNTLARRAVQDTEFQCMQDGLTGPLVLAFSKEDPGAAARVIDAFAKTNDKLKIRLVALGGKLIDPKDIKAVASLPTKDQAISQLMSVMLAPVQKLAGTLNEIPSKITRVVKAVGDQKAAASGG